MVRVPGGGQDFPGDADLVQQSPAFTAGDDGGTIGGNLAVVVLGMGKIRDELAGDLSWNIPAQKYSF